MKSRLSVLIGAALIAVLAVGCGEKPTNVVAPAAPTAVRTIATTLSAGPVDQSTQESYYLLTDDQRVELLAYLREKLTDDQIKARPDLYALLGHLYTDTMSVADAAAADAAFQKAHPASAKEYITVGGLPWYSQNNPTWKNYFLGYSTKWKIGDSGCFLTSICDVLTVLRSGATPYTLNFWSKSGQDHYAFAKGTANISISQAISYPNICRPWSTIKASDYENVRRQLRAGHPVVVYTTWGGGHYMVVYCWDGSQFWVDDPWPTSNNLHPLNGYGAVYCFYLLGYSPV